MLQVMCNIRWQVVLGVLDALLVRDGELFAEALSSSRSFKIVGSGTDEICHRTVGWSTDCAAIVGRAASIVCHGLTLLLAYETHLPVKNSNPGLVCSRIGEPPA